MCCDDNGMASFDRIRYGRHNERVFLYAFDLIELDGEDMRREPFETSKATLARLGANAGPSASPGSSALIWTWQQSC